MHIRDVCVVRCTYETKCVFAGRRCHTVGTSAKHPNTPRAYMACIWYIQSVIASKHSYVVAACHRARHAIPKLYLRGAVCSVVSVVVIPVACPMYIGSLVLDILVRLSYVYWFACPMYIGSLVLDILVRLS